MICNGNYDLKSQQGLGTQRADQMSPQNWPDVRSYLSTVSEPEVRSWLAASG